MGIPGLKRLLELYATPRGTKIEPCRAAIDGPALSYHILSLCLKRTLKSSPFEQPSYELLGQTAVAWLGKIEEYGIIVSAIYFDGLLPQSKREERMQRLLVMTKQLERYRLAYPEGVPRQRAEFDDTAAVELFPKTRGKDAKLAAPIPSFLVASIIDALSKSSAYASRVKMMPGEADGFCAENVRAHGGLVLTSDSDLLVHDLGNDGGVVFFADLNLDTELKALTAPLFRVEDISKRLSLKGDHSLAKLAFELVIDPSLTIEQAAELSRRATAATNNPSNYAEFFESYLSPETVTDSVERDDRPILDPRVSELALRCLPATKDCASSNKRADRASKDLAIYLPFLLDFPVRISAWETSKSIRQLSYSLLQLARNEPIASVAEFRRPQSPSSGLQAPCFTPSDIGKEASELLDLLSRIETGITSPSLQWMVLAVYLDVDLSMRQGKENPLSLELLRQYTLGTLDQGSWSFIHFLAQLQALLYSLRILKQIMEFTARYALERLSPETEKLRERLGELPPFTTFPSLRGFGEMFREFGKANALQCLSSLFSGQQEVLDQIESVQKAPTPKKGRKGKKRKASMPITAPVRPLSRNPFDILAGQD
ncbi:XPG domain containing-domain-containing protein [Cercophora newfieldiana]|uniref:XPG domain containing-domain-containing protein n=1 Tax=Cercophora newfieldiana TaxID=92897 RepID=A0AA40CM37_9PEZI|nr:XPG domain containing-domain-containing protein [Cercophora newfieldiana]